VKLENFIVLHVWLTYPTHCISNSGKICQVLWTLW